MVQLDENRFLTELGRMYERHKSSGSVWVTMKCSNGKPRSRTREYPREEYKCLVRAVAGKAGKGGKPGKKKEIATMVGTVQFPKFQQAMIVIMKANMDALKKKEKMRKA